MILLRANIDICTFKWDVTTALVFILERPVNKGCCDSTKPGRGQKLEQPVFGLLDVPENGYTIR
jgi:hypothetical protein